jgi:PTS system N-acetylglucosamine-specific IIC component
MGVVRPSAQVAQVVLGPIADQVAGEIRAHLRDAGSVAASPLTDAAVPPPRTLVARELLVALGGQGNVHGVEVRGTRLLVEVRDAGRVELQALLAAGVRDAAFSPAGTLHIVLEGAASEVAAMLTGRTPG